MFVELALVIRGTAAGASLSGDNTVAIFHFIMNCIICNPILRNFVMITVFKFGCLIDDFSSRLTLQLKFLVTMFLVHVLTVDKLSRDAQNSYVNVDMMYKYFKQFKLKC
jgi:hypothetical protein